jgi:hypothetical protein
VPGWGLSSCLSCFPELYHAAGCHEPFLLTSGSPQSLEWLAIVSPTFRALQGPWKTVCFWLFSAC